MESPNELNKGGRPRTPGGRADKHDAAIARKAAAKSQPPPAKRYLPRSSPDPRRPDTKASRQDTFEFGLNVSHRPGDLGKIDKLTLAINCLSGSLQREDNFDGCIYDAALGVLNVFCGIASPKFGGWYISSDFTCLVNFLYPLAIIQPYLKSGGRAATVCQLDAAHSGVPWESYGFLTSDDGGVSWQEPDVLVGHSRIMSLWRRLQHKLAENIYLCKHDIAGASCPTMRLSWIIFEWECAYVACSIFWYYQIDLARLYDIVHKSEQHGLDIQWLVDMMPKAGYISSAEMQFKYSCAVALASDDAWFYRHLCMDRIGHQCGIPLISPIHTRLVWADGIPDCAAFVDDPLHLLVTPYDHKRLNMMKIDSAAHWGQPDTERLRDLAESERTIDVGLSTQWITAAIEQLYGCGDATKSPFRGHGCPFHNMVWTEHRIVHSDDDESDDTTEVSMASTMVCC